MGVYIYIVPAPPTTHQTRDGGVFRSNKLPGLNSTGDRCPTCYYCSANQFDHTSITIIRPRRYNTDSRAAPTGRAVEQERERERERRKNTTRRIVKK
jgi:hypothetical protein